MISSSCLNSDGFDASESVGHLLAMVSPRTLSMSMWDFPRCVKAWWTLGIGTEVCSAMN